MTVTIAFDTETKGLDWFDPDQRAFLGQWADADEAAACNLTTEEGRQAFIEKLGEADVLIAHNMPFDCHQVRETLGLDIRDRELHDTQILARAVLPNEVRYGLKPLAKKYLDPKCDAEENAIKEMGKQLKIPMSRVGAYFDIWQAYPQVMEEYGIADARYTYDLFQYLMNKATPEQLAVYEFEMKVQRILIEAERKGIAVDSDKAKELHEHYTELLEETLEKMPDKLRQAALGGDGSAALLLETLVEDIGVPLYRQTDTGQLRTDKFALSEFEDQFEELRLLEKSRTYQRFLTTYTGPMVGQSTVHASFFQWEARTSRMSCRRPNMQNIPKRAGKEVREMFVPREGHSFVVVDYDSIEVRLLAYYLNSKEFRALIDGGHDPHAWMASQIHGGAIEDYRKGTPGQAHRDIAKNTLFAIVYGAGAPRVADMNKMPIPEARKLIKKIKTSLPRYHRLNERVKKRVQTAGFVKTIMGRTLAVPKDKPYVGLNTLIQGSAAEIMKQGLINAAEAVKPVGGYPLLLVHDEIVIEVPTENADECLKLTQEALESAYELDPALKTTGSVVHNNYAEA